MTEEELIQAFQSGDQSAFARLVEENQGRIYALCYRMTGSREDAADLTQDAFLRAWQFRENFQGHSALSTWLYRLALNGCIDFLRREKRRGSLSMTLDEDGEDWQAQISDERWAPEDVLERSQLQHLLWQGLDALSPEHRQILVLREMEGLSYREIGKYLRLEEGTVKSRIARARLALRDFLVRSGNISPPQPSKKETGRKGGRD